MTVKRTLRTILISGLLTLSAAGSVAASVAVPAAAASASAAAPSTFYHGAPPG